MRKGIVRVLAAILACSTSMSCATVIHQTSQDVGIASIPSGASVAIDNRPTGKTPLVADLKRKENHVIKIEMPGYETYETTVTHKVSGWVWGNVVFGGLIGLAIDALSGGMYKLTPDQITAELRKQGQASFMKRDGLYLAVVLTPEPNWEKVGQLKRLALRIE